MGQQLFERGPIGRGKARFKQEILRRITGQGQLRKKNNVDFLFPGPGQEMLHFGRITLDVTDR